MCYYYVVWLYIEDDDVLLVSYLVYAFLEREYLLLKTENGDQKAILLQYEERFSEVKKHIESLNMEKQ